MAEIDKNIVKTIVEDVLSDFEREKVSPGHPGARTFPGVFDHVEDAVQATVQAQKTWRWMPLETRRRVIEALRQAMHSHAEEFARMACQETGMGRIEDKVRKHHNAARVTPGLEDLTSRSWSGDRGLVVEEYAPWGVLAAVTPSTHPIPVLLNSTIIMIAPGNGVVFSVHPAAKQVSAHAMGIFNRAIQEAGGPPNLVTMVKEPTLENVRLLFESPQIAMIVATGGPDLVKAAFASGKKVIAAGPGNPPVVVDGSAELELAARHIISGASFDNNLLCIAEKEVFVVEEVFDSFMNAMEKEGAFRLNATQVDRLAGKVFSRSGEGKWAVSRHFVGRNASVLAGAVGVTLQENIRLLFAETDFDHPFVQEEQMMPFLPVVKAKNLEQAIQFALEAEHGYGHTAVIHAHDLDAITRFSREIDTDIVVVNGPSYAGNGPPAGEGYFSHTIASPTGEGICTPKDFARVRRVCFLDSLRIV